MGRYSSTSPRLAVAASPMIAAARQMLKDLRVPEAQIAYDEF
jgi:hypothetical protein